MPDLPNFPIPSETPEETRCIRLQIPDNDDWVQIFVGLLAQPSYWFNWQRDDNKNGKELARHWTKIYDKIDWSNMSCCDDKVLGTRINTDTGAIEITFDGTTWQNAALTGNDPRYTSPQFPPIPTSGSSSDDRCRSANNAVSAMQTAIEAFGGELGTVGSLIALAGVIALAVVGVFAIPPSATVLVPIIIGLAQAIFSIASGTYLALFTSDVYNDLQCILYCHCPEDGTYDQSSYLAILSDIDAHGFNVNVALTFTSVIQGWALPGLNAAARGGELAVGDCSDCPDCEIAVYVINQSTGIFEVQLPDVGTDNQYTIPAQVYPPTGIYAFYQFFQDNVAAPPPSWKTAHYLTLFSTGTIVSRGTYNSDGTATGGHWPASDECPAGLYAESSVPFTVTFTVTFC